MPGFSRAAAKVTASVPTGSESEDTAPLPLAARRGAGWVMRGGGVSETSAGLPPLQVRRDSTREPVRASGRHWSRFAVRVKVEAGGTTLRRREANRVRLDISLPWSFHSRPEVARRFWLSALICVMCDFDKPVSFALSLHMLARYDCFSKTVQTSCRPGMNDERYTRRLLLAP